MSIPIQLISSDGKYFDIDSSIAESSQYLKQIIDFEEDEGSGPQQIPIPNVTSSILVLVIEFMRHHTAIEPMSAIEKVRDCPRNTRRS